MSAAGYRARLGAGQRDQLAMVPDAAGPELGPVVPGPRASRSGGLRPVPEFGEPGREADRWRMSGRDARVLTPFSATACTGNAGLCGVCTGGPCAHDLELRHDENDQQVDDEDIEP